MSAGWSSTGRETRETERVRWVEEEKEREKGESEGDFSGCHILYEV